MAHGPDPALTRAIREVIRSLRGNGWSTHDLAERLEVSPPTITRWENGARAPSLDLLPRFDALLGRRRGEVLRKAGYVEDDPADVRSAIMAASELSDIAKTMLVAAYEGVLSSSRTAETASKAALRAGMAARR